MFAASILHSSGKWIGTGLVSGIQNEKQAEINRPATELRDCSASALLCQWLSGDSLAPDNGFNVQETRGKTEALDHLQGQLWKTLSSVCRCAPGTRPAQNSMPRQTQRLARADTDDKSNRQIVSAFDSSPTINAFFTSSPIRLPEPSNMILGISTRSS